MNRFALKAIVLGCYGVLYGCSALDPQSAVQGRAPAAVQMSGLSEYEQGKSLLRLGQLGGALTVFNSAVLREPKNAEVHNARGVVLFELGQSDAAASSFDRAIQLSPNGAHFYFNLGVAQARQGRVEAAAGSLLQAMRIDPLNSQAQAHWKLVMAKLDTERANVWLARRDRLESPVNGTWDAGVVALPQPKVSLAQPIPTTPNSAVMNLSYPAQLLGSVPANVPVAPANEALPARAAAQNPRVTTKPALVSKKDAVRVVKVGAAARVKVVNGAGKNRAAQRFGDRLSSNKDFQLVKVANHNRFDVQRSQIVYRAGFRKEANLLGKRFSSSKVVQHTGKAEADWDILVIVGSDLATTKSLGRIRM